MDEDDAVRSKTIGSARKKSVYESADRSNFAYRSEKK